MENTDWIRFLCQHAAETTTIGHISFPPQESAIPLPPGSPQLVPVINRGILEVRGPDTDKLLQGQLTCDLQQLTETTSLLGACCTPKGRALTVFRIARLAPDRILLRMPIALLDTVCAHLTKYSVFFQVELTPRPEMVILGLIGATGQLDGVPDGLGENQCQITPNSFCVRVPGQLPRWELWLDQSQAEARWQAFARTTVPTSTLIWEQHEVLAGLPEIWPENSEAFIPQMINLQALGGVSFRKGCYTGQEIIARMQYRGQLKKRLYLFSARNQPMIPPGTPLCLPERTAPAGNVVNSAPDKEAGTILLAVVRIDAIGTDSENLRLGDANGPQLSLLPMPYTP